MKKLFLLVMTMMILQGCNNGEKALLPSKEYFVEVVKELSGKEYYGRSNYKDGAVRAGDYILGEIEKLGVETIPQDVIEKAWEGKERPQLHALQPEFKSLITPAGEGRWAGAPEWKLSYMQNFTHPLNAQRGAVELVVDGDTLNHTVQYTLKEFSPTFKGDLEVVYLDDKYITPSDFCKYVNSGAFKDKAVVLNWDRFRETMYTYPGIEVYKTYFVPMENVAPLFVKVRNCSLTSRAVTISIPQCRYLW